MTTRWRDVAAQMDRFEPDWNSALRYLDECHADWMDAWAGWADENLEIPVRRHQGDDWPAWRIFETLSHHDSYHAGQVAVAGAEMGSGLGRSARRSPRHDRWVRRRHVAPSLARSV